MKKMPLPTMQILQILKQEETQTPKQILDNLTEFTPKDIKYALRRLREKGIIKKIPNLVDMRRVFYRLATIDEFSESQSILKMEEYLFYHSIISGSDELVETLVENNPLAKIS